VVSHIHKLDDKAFVNLAPHHLVNDALHKQTADIENFKISGGEGKRAKETYMSVYNVLLSSVPENKQHHVDLSRVDIDILLRDYETFISNNFDRTNLTKQKLKKAWRDKKNQKDNGEDYNSDDGKKGEEEYKPWLFKNEQGGFDFSLCKSGYNEEVARFNIKKVVHAADTVIARPTREVPREAKQVFDYVKMNKTSASSVSRLNFRRNKQIKLAQQR
jgi:hypothetical protein